VKSDVNDWISADYDRKRDEILRSLSAYLQRTRQSSLTMQDVADQLNLSKGTLYNYFNSKQDIVFHCHMKVMEMSLTALREAQQTRGSAAKRLQTLLEKHIRGMTDEVYGGVLFLPIDDLDAPQRRKYIDLRDQFERGVRRFIDDGIERSEFRSVDSRVASLAILGSINWLPRWYRPEGGLSAAELATQFASLFMHSLIAVRSNR
jgi:AcrR family transcriptional regulator